MRVITVSSAVVATAVAATNLTGVSAVVTGAGISAASWNPSISIVVPANFAPGVYFATPPAAPGTLSFGSAAE